MTRCKFCKNGNLPDTIRVTVVTVYTLPKGWLPVLCCPDCLNPLSYTSARKLNHALVEVVEYK